MDMNNRPQPMSGGMWQNQGYPIPMNWNMPSINPWTMQIQPTQPQTYNYQPPSQPQQAPPQPTQQTAPQPVQQPAPQTPQSNTQHHISSARVVVSQDEIKPNEIPMDDSITIFLQDDLNRVYGKRWTNNGTVENLEYVRVDNTAQQSAAPAQSFSNEGLDEFRAEVNARFDQMSDMLKKWLE